MSLIRDTRSATASVTVDPKGLINSGFETGDFTGWVVGGKTTKYGVAKDGKLIPYPRREGFDFSEDFFTNVRNGSFAGFAVVAVAYGEEITLAQTVDVAPSTMYSVGYYVNTNAPDIVGFSFQTHRIKIDVEGTSLDLDTGIGNGCSDYLTKPNCGNGPHKYQFRRVFGDYHTTQNQTSATVVFTIIGSGGKALLNFDDFHFTDQ